MGPIDCELEWISNGWDGRIPGQGIAPEGVYTFLVRAMTNAGAQIEQGGTITPIRGYAQTDISQQRPHRLLLLQCLDQARASQTAQ